MKSYRLYSNLPSLPCSKVWAEIDEAALVNNFNLLRKKNVGSRPIAVVKADAYGHTAAISVNALLDAGCDFFAVSCIEEAIEVRNICNAKNSQAEVLILGYTAPQYAKLLSKNNVIQAIVGEDHAAAFEKSAKENNCKIRVHIALDTGMNRIGLSAGDENECREAAETVKRLVSSRVLSVEGLFTHFAKADEDESAVFSSDSGTVAQFKRFMTVKNLLSKENINLFCHVCNSAAAVRFPEFALDGVRLGILLYGVRPSDKMTAETSPVMSLHTKVAHVHILSEGEQVSYGGKYVADSKATVATLPIGYADGFLRAYEGFKVTIHTEKGDFKAPVIGRICMDQCMVDVTNIPVKTGDRVTVFDASPHDLATLAAMANTIEYEVLCLISGRVPRIKKTSPNKRGQKE